MGISERRKREILELRNTILEHATEIIAHEGYSGFSIRKLAESIDYSPRMIYLYFKDKDAILLALVEEAYARTLFYRETHQLPPEPIERIRVQLHNHIKNALEHPEHYRVIVDILNRDGCTPGPRQLELESLVREDIALLQPRIAKEQLEASSYTIFASLRGLAMHLIAHRNVLSLEMLEMMADTYVNWIIDGLSHWKQQD